MFVLVPLGLAAAVSPVMLTEQTVLLAAPEGRRTGLLYAAGAVTVMAVLVGSIVLVGQSLSLPKAPQLSASLDLLIGGLLLALALALRVWRPSNHSTDQRSRRRMNPSAAFAFGVFSMTTNVTTLALVVPGAKEIAASHLAAWEGIAAAVSLVALVCLPAWGPVALTSVAPGTASKVLNSLERLIHRHGRQFVILLIAVASAFLLLRGLLLLVNV
jgi:threonine/homoserine/homoserine lactone efflux protein